MMSENRNEWNNHRTISWRPQSPPHSAKKRLREGAYKPESELSVLGKVLANVNAETSKRHRFGVLEPIPFNEGNSNSNDSISGGKKMLESWFASSQNPSAHTHQDDHKSSNSGSENGGDKPPVQESDDSNLFNIIERLETQMKRDTKRLQHSTNVVKQMTSSSSASKKKTLLTKADKLEIERKKQAAIQRREQLRLKQQQQQHRNHHPMKNRMMVQSHHQRRMVSLPQKQQQQQKHRKPMKQLPHNTTQPMLRPTPKLQSLVTPPKTVEVAVEEDDDFDALACMVAAKYDNISAQQTNLKSGVLPLVSLSVDGKSYTRFKVLDVHETVGHVILHASSRPGRLGAEIQLRDIWAEVLPERGDYINVIWTQAVKPKWQACEEMIEINDDQNFLIICPDLLVSPTRVAGSIDCVRRAVLSQHVQSFEPNQHTVMGNIRHELVERGFLPFSEDGEETPKPNFDQGYLASVTEKLIQKPEFVQQLFEVDCCEEFARNELQHLFVALRAFAQRFIGTDPRDMSNKENLVSLGHGRYCRFSIEEVISTEENIISPMWGLHGMVDLLVRAVILDPHSSDPPVQVLLPLELKTGHRIQKQHHAQVILYSLLLSDRYQGLEFGATTHFSDCAGLLLHAAKERKRDSSDNNDNTHVASLVGVETARNYLVSLIRARNVFASASAPKWMKGSSVPRATIPEEQDMEDLFDIAEEEGEQVQRQKQLHLSTRLPSVLQNQSSICKNCYEKDTCMTFHKALDNGTAETSGLGDEFDKIVQHLTEADLDYFKLWNEMINLEEDSSNSTRREIWALTGPERESKGRCMATMKLVSTVLINADHISRRYESRFERHHEKGNVQFPSLLELHFEPGDFVTLSIEDRHLGVCSGFLYSMGTDYVVIRTENPIPLPNTEDETILANLHWRLDKDEKYAGLRAVKGNLMQLLSPACSRLRDLIIGLKSPEFADDVANSTQHENRKIKPEDSWLRNRMDLPDSVWSGKLKLSDVRNFPKMNALTKRDQIMKSQTNADLRAKYSPKQANLVREYENLNPDQKRAVVGVLAAKDYVCIQGMPGTGKTTTIGLIIQILCTLNCSVLVCAYTHSAVDNLLIKLKEKGFPFVRIGNPENVHPAVRDSILGENAISVRRMKELVDCPNLVVGATCLGTKHPLIRKKKFDFCIIDEAGQLTQPVCFGPIFCSDTFVLVGDDEQLPPLVKSERAKELGMTVSLLKRLSGTHPKAVVNLTFQFRMNGQIMKLANCLTYKDQLKCGSQVVATQRLRMDNYPNQDIRNRSKLASGSQWLLEVLDPRRPVLFLNTDEVLVGGAKERRSSVARTYATVSQRDRELKNAGFISQGSGPSQDDETGTTSNRRQTHHGLLENTVEARLCKLLVIGLVKCGLRLDQIGIISPYRSQLRLLRRELDPHFGPELEIQTVDRYQGRDKDCIIVSLVRSNDTRDVGGLLKDSRRINVAFTRAKRKLLVIGSKETLTQSEIFGSFLEIVGKEKWNYQLPQSAHLAFSHLESSFKHHL